MGNATLVQLSLRFLNVGIEIEPGGEDWLLSQKRASLENPNIAILSSYSISFTAISLLNTNY